MLSHASARALLVGALLVLTSTPVFAQLIPDWDVRSLRQEQINADLVLLVREVEVVGVGPNAGNQIFADEIEWNLRTGAFTATGNVLLVSPTFRLSAERVTFNTRTRLGTFETASGIAALGARGLQDKSMFGTLEPDVYFYGKTIEKIGDDKYRITDGGFTTCVQPTPRWEIVSGHATIALGDYAVLRNAVVRVKHVPVFYLPIMYYPIQDDDRATGFLLPTYGQSTYRGQSLSNAFFWAITRSQDATLMHDWFASRGQGGGAEYRYVAGANADGFFRGYWLNEKEAEIDVPGGGTSLQPARRSFELRGRLVQPLPAKLTARANVDYFSDVVTQTQYNTNIYDATRSQRQYGATVTGSFGHLNLTGMFARSELFYSQTSSVISGTEPGITLNFASTRIGRLPLYFAANSDAARTVLANRTVSTSGVDTVVDTGLTRMELFPTLRSPLTNWPFLSVTTYLGVRSTYFSESLDAQNVQVPIGVWRRYAEMRAEVTGPVVSRVFSPQNKFAERLKHVVEPNFSIQRTTGASSQTQIPSTGSTYDIVIGGVTRMSYGLTNRVLMRPPPDPEAMAAGTAPTAGAPRELLSVSVFQSYYTDARASQYDPTVQSALYRPVSKFSPWVLSVRSAPTQLSAAGLVVEYDASRGVLETLSLSGSLNYRQVQSRVGWSSRSLGLAMRNETFDVNTTLNLAGGRAQGTYSMNWDITRGQILQQRWIGSYNAQCCGLTMEYQEFAFGFGSAIPKDHRFNLSFTLAGIGNFSNFFGAFGGGQQRY